MVNKLLEVNTKNRVNTLFIVLKYLNLDKLLKNKGGDILALEAIKEIESSEKKAMEIIKLAQLESTEIIKNAQKKSEDVYKKILSESREDAKKIIDKAIIEAKEESVPIKNKGEEEARAIREISIKEIEKAVNLVIERIVNINGNS